MNSKNKIPKTERELKNWMQDNCFNFQGYSIGGNSIYEGFGIENSGGLYIWYYTERGQKEHLKYFQTEEEIINYAYNQINSDKWANSHCIGFTENKAKSKALANLLTQLAIQYEEDEIPYYGLERPIYRTFVFGCDILKTKELKQEYYDEIE
jgi:hypothetical protein